MSVIDGPFPGAKRSEVGGVTIDEVPAGTSRVKRVIYPPGWVWEVSMAPVVGTEWCEHVHVGFLTQGEMELSYPDGCSEVLRAPTAVVVAPGHRAAVLGDEAVVLIQVDCGPDTVERLGLHDIGHGHG